ncbi:hypothetical protein D3C71_1566010 [compost metagenome]
MRLIETAVCRMQAIGLFRDGEGDDMDEGAGEISEDALPVSGGAEPVDGCADDLARVAIAVAYGDRIEAVLRCQRIDRFGRAQVDCDDAPGAEFALQRTLGINALMRTVEGSEAEMQYAGAKFGAVVARLGDAGGKLRFGGKMVRHRPSPNWLWLNARSMPRSSASPFKRPMAG